MQFFYRLSMVSEERWIKWGKNLLKFTAPALAAFFTQLAMGVEWRAAALFALIIFYGAAADFFNKIGSQV